MADSTAVSTANLKGNDRKAAIAENSIVADTLTHYEDEKVEISIEDAFSLHKQSHPVAGRRETNRPGTDFYT